MEEEEKQRRREELEMEKSKISEIKEKAHGDQEEQRKRTPTHDEEGAGIKRKEDDEKIKEMERQLKQKEIGIKLKEEEEARQRAQKEKEKEEKAKMTQQQKEAEEKEKKATKRTNIVQEIVAVEKNYVHGLGLVVRKYLTPLTQASKTARPILSAEKIKLVFSIIEIIHNYHTILFERLESRVKRWLADQKATPLVIGDIFVLMSTHLSCYSQYVNNFDVAIATLNEEKKINPTFTQFCTRVEASSEFNYQDLESFLIHPVQQLPRYILLLNDLLRATTNDHPDHGTLVEATEKIRKLAATVNQKKKEAEDAAAVISVLQKITRKRPSDLVQHDRKFIKEGALTFGENGHFKYKEGYVFLFSDLIVFTSRIANKTEYTYRGQVPLQGGAVENLKDDTRVKNGIGLKNGNRTFILSAAKPDDKAVWLRTLLNAIFALSSTKN